MFESLKTYAASWLPRNQRSVTLQCDNPQCHYPIDDGSLAYSREHEEVYHDGRCLMFAEAHRMARTRSPEAVIVEYVDYISMCRAKSLFLRGNLKQARGEKPVSMFAPPK